MGMGRLSNRERKEGDGEMGWDGGRWNKQKAVGCKEKERMKKIDTPHAVQSNLI